MSAVATMPTWSPPIHLKSSEASTQGSSLPMQMTGSGPHTMSPEELRAMLEKNRGEKLVPVTDWNK